MDKEITLISAFFDIGRKDYKTYSRSVEKYFEYFSMWARMKNKLIVYTDTNMKNEIMKIRKNYGLESKTIVIEINNIDDIEKEILEKMNKVSESYEFRKIRYIEDAVSNKAKYDYVMLLKYWCLNDAVKNQYANGMVAWIDFGFNHGGKCYTNAEQFDFNWKTKLSSEKIHIFSLNELDDTPIFKYLLKLNDLIMGCLVILDSSLCDRLWKLVKDSMEALLKIGFIDDDQLLLLMAYKEEKNLFELHISDWFMPLKENGGEHLTVKLKENKKENIIKKILFFLRKKRAENDYLKRLKDVLIK